MNCDACFYYKRGFPFPLPHNQFKGNQLIYLPFCSQKWRYFLLRENIWYYLKSIAKPIPLPPNQTRLMPIKIRTDILESDYTDYQLILFNREAECETFLSVEKATSILLKE